MKPTIFLSYYQNLKTYITVTVTNNPSGTFATIIPIANTRLDTYSVGNKMKPIVKNVTPIKIAIAEMI